MTPLEIIKNMDSVTITPAVAASVLRINPHSIRVAAHREPQSIGFPVIIIGSRVLIPRLPFIEFVESGSRWFSRTWRIGIVENQK